MNPLLELRRLHLSIAGQEILYDLNLSLPTGRTTALVGESGSGKSMTAAAILRLLPPRALCQGEVLWQGENLLQCSERRLRGLRGGELAMIYQEPLSALNPLHRVGRQICEGMIVHRGLRQQAAVQRARTLLGEVGLSADQLERYPHELSGGQRQRIMIAMALANEPRLLIADEPTTALDVTLQRQILDLLHDLQERRQLTLLFITHDLSLVRHYSDQVAVMQAGRIIEQATTSELFSAAHHPYTQTLLAAEPSGGPIAAVTTDEALLDVRGLCVDFSLRGGLLRRVRRNISALHDVHLQLRAGQTYGVVGESGSGKTTLGLALLRLIAAQGQVLFMGQDLMRLDQRALRPWRRHLQMVFQDPYASLSPRQNVAQTLTEGLAIHGLDRAECQRRIDQALRDVQLDPAMQERYPHEFSGGQRQRIAIARALVLQPRLIVLDEPTSALDRSVQKQVVDLLRQLQERYRFAMIFISHDLKVVKALSHHLLVLRAGQVIEQGDAASVFRQPQQDYTRLLLSAAGLIDG